MSVAALELLAAQVVAEIGTYTALSDARAAALGLSAGAGDGAGARAATAATDGGTSARIAALAASVPGAFTASAPGALAAQAATPGAAGREPGEAEVFGAAAAMVPAHRRARFEALYVALSQSPAALHWSPAARAARALALAGRSEEAPVSARERAAAAWDVLPVVYGGAGPGDAAAIGEAGSVAASATAAVQQAIASYVAPTWLGGSRTAAPRARTAGGRAAPDMVAAGGFMADLPQVAGAGLAGLSARAGEALGSYVTPAAPPSAPRESSRDGAVLRAPTAAPEYVQTGRSAGRYGGGEVEIPAWFEAAARRMLADRTGDGTGISISELTLVTSTPSNQIAASTRAATSAAATPAPAAAAQPGKAPQIDVEKLATEVYRNILVLMDVARARNGDPNL
jgi:hypothetical protein